MQMDFTEEAIGVARSSSDSCAIFGASDYYDGMMAELQASLS